MKSFDSVYGKNRNNAINEQKAAIDKDHATIVAAVKKEFGINDFRTLSEAERDSYRSMINEMWNKEVGLTEKGVAFLNESKLPLTPESTDEQVVKFIKKSISPSVERILQDVILKKESKIVKETKAAIDSQIGKKYSNKLYRQQVGEILVAYVAKAVNSIKL